MAKKNQQIREVEDNIGGLSLKRNYSNFYCDAVLFL